jgi:hypothetical protein
VSDADVRGSRPQPPPGRVPDDRPVVTIGSADDVCRWDIDCRAHDLAGAGASLDGPRPAVSPTRVSRHGLAE